MRWLVAIAVAAALLACSDRIAVLGPRAQPQRQGDGGADPDDGPPSQPNPRSDAGMMPAGSGGGAGDRPGSISTGAGQTDAGEPPPPPTCDLQCGPNELCTNQRCVPAQGVMSLACSFGHSCSVESGRLYCWGANDVGQLGLGDTTPRLEPDAVPGATAVAQIAAGGGSACAIDEGGGLFCWGDNLEGKPGQADPYSAPDVVSPQRVGTDRWKLVAVGQGHVCGVRADGPVFCWGRNTDLALGIGSPDPAQARKPTATMTTGTFTSLSASQHHTCGVRADGSLWCWGRNEHSELSAPAADLPISSVPVQVGSDVDWAEAAVGWFHSCARKQNGNVYCWGRAIEGQLAQDRIEPNPLPTKIESPLLWKRISTGHFHTCGVDAMTGLIHCTGENGNGQLGLGDLTRRHMPEPLP
jgi:alpha-tubulin suppressor-like RCC1 family protein